MKNLTRSALLHDRLLRSPGVPLALAAALLLALFAHLGAPETGSTRTEVNLDAGQGRSGLVAVLLEAWYTPTLEPTLTVTPTSTATPTFTATPTIILTPTAVAPTATAPPTSAPATSAPTMTPLPTATPQPTPTPRPLPTPDGIVRTLRIPILMYHYISVPPENADAVRRDLSVRPEVFAEHLRYLREAGYTTISLEDLVLALTVGAPLPERPIVLTFDDGYRDAYEQAYPLLKESGFTGTFFVVTSFVDQGNPNHLTWEQVAEMSAGGMSIESHGYTHDEMEGRDREFLIWQMLGSKEAIEARTGKPVRFFCYPSGYYDEHAKQVLHELDYWAATTIVFGQEHTSDSLFDLHRIRIHGDYTVERVAALLEALQAP